MSVDGPDCMWMFRTARQESAGADMCRVASSVVQRTLATRGRKEATEKGASFLCPRVRHI